MLLGHSLVHGTAVKQRMRSVTNIQKITKAMKMVAASKMRVAQVSTEKARGLIVPLYKSLGDLPGQATALVCPVLISATQLILLPMHAQALRTAWSLSSIIQHGA